MIIHNTTYSVLPGSEERWVRWTKEHHITGIEALPGVRSCRFLKLLTEVESDGVTYTVQTEIETLPAGELFLEKHDPAMQERMLGVFPGEVVFFQTLLKVL